MSKFTRYFDRSLNRCKSNGIDKIPAKIIRIACPEITKSIKKIFNRAILSEVVPSKWKTARVASLKDSLYSFNTNFTMPGQ